MPAQPWLFRAVPTVMDNLGYTELYRHMTVAHPGRTNSYGQPWVHWAIQAYDRDTSGPYQQLWTTLVTLGYTGIWQWHIPAVPTVMDSLGTLGYTGTTVAHPGRTNSYGQPGLHRAIPAYNRGTSEPYQQLWTTCVTLGYTAYIKCIRGTSRPYRQLWTTWVTLGYDGTAVAHPGLTNSYGQPE